MYHRGSYAILPALRPCLRTLPSIALALDRRVVASGHRACSSLCSLLDSELWLQAAQGDVVDASFSHAARELVTLMTLACSSCVCVARLSLGSRCAVRALHRVVRRAPSAPRQRARCGADPRSPWPPCSVSQPLAASRPSTTAPWPRLCSRRPCACPRATTSSRASATTTRLCAVRAALRPRLIGTDDNASGRNLYPSQNGNAITFRQLPSDMTLIEGDAGKCLCVRCLGGFFDPLQEPAVVRGGRSPTECSISQDRRRRWHRRFVRASLSSSNVV